MTKENINITIPKFILNFIEEGKEAGIFSSRSHALKRMAQFYMDHCGQGYEPEWCEAALGSEGVSEDI